jgi:hypothetical protein
MAANHPIEPFEAIWAKVRRGGMTGHCFRIKRPMWVEEIVFSHGLGRFLPLRSATPADQAFDLRDA